MNPLESTNEPKRSLDEASKLLVSKEILACQSILVNELLKREIISYDEISHLYNEETGEPEEIFEWWLIGERLAEKLDESGECILDSEYGTWWGRSCCGQAIYLDHVIREIAKRYFM